jgi:transcription antitermination factor NusG
MSHGESQWFALYVKSRSERVTEQCLSGKGYEAFSPVYESRRKRSDRMVIINSPLFPGYVFCRFDVTKRLPILTTPGVVTIVGPGNIPEPISPAEIQSLRCVVTSGRAVEPWPLLRQGQRVRIESGPLSGTEGVLLTVKNQLRLVVTITLLQRSIAVEVDRDSVRPLFEQRADYVRQTPLQAAG